MFRKGPVFVRISTATRCLYYFLFTNVKENNNCLLFLVNRIVRIIVIALRNVFFAPASLGKIILLSQEYAFI